MQKIEEAGQGNESDGEMDARWVELNAVQESVPGARTQGSQSPYLAIVTVLRGFQLRWEKVGEKLRGNYSTERRGSVAQREIGSTNEKQRLGSFLHFLTADKSYMLTVPLNYLTTSWSSMMKERCFSDMRFAIREANGMNSPPPAPSYHTVSTISTTLRLVMEVASRELALQKSRCVFWRAFIVVFSHFPAEMGFTITERGSSSLVIQDHIQEALEVFSVANIQVERRDRLLTQYQMYQPYPHLGFFPGKANPSAFSDSGDDASFNTSKRIPPSIYSTFPLFWCQSCFSHKARCRDRKIPLFGRKVYKSGLTRSLVGS